MAKKHEHPSSPKIECEKCGGEVKIINVVYPHEYECVCKTCNHKFTWLSTKDE